VSILVRPPLARECQGRLSRGALFLFTRSLAPLCVALTISAFALAQPLTIVAHSDPPPGDLADPIEALMAAGGQRIRVGQTSLEFWWVKTLPLTEDSRGVAWTALADGTLAGAVTLSASYPDMRGQMIPAGSYTLRYVTPVLLLSPVADDERTDPLGRVDAEALAKQTPGAVSPPAWRITPANDAAKPPRTADDSPASLTVTLPVSRAGMDVGALTFELVLAGSIQP
jgi:hypothetical protein